MWSMASLVAVVAPRTGKIIKNSRSDFERRENMLQKCILHFVFKLSVRNRVTKLEFTLTFLTFLLGI